MNKPVVGKNDSVETQVPDQEPVSADVGLLFLANFVHQVVNPMNGVIGTLSNITDGTYSETVVQQKVNASRAQLEQCVTLIRNLAYLSDYFFATSGKSSLRPPTKDVGTSVLPQVIIEAMQFFQILGERKRIRLELIHSSKQYRVNVRPELLKQVFINLFDNWLKYGEREQVVKVEPSVTAAGDLVVVTYGKSNLNGYDFGDGNQTYLLY